MKEDFGSRYFRGQGPFFLGDRDADGNPINLIFVGDLESAELTPDVQRSTVYENTTGKNAVGSSFLQRTGYNVALGFRSTRKEHFKQALGATATGQASSSGTDERHTVKVGSFARLKHLQVSNVSVTIDPDGTASSATADTDYKLHAEEGLIEILSGGGISDDDEIGVFARRAGDIRGEHELVLAGNDEVVSLSHCAEDRGVFAAGALDAAVWLAERGDGWHEFDDVIDAA
jgi:hypothetical protein